MNCLIWLLSVILIPLSAIDTLMQSQPDSALTVLLDEPTDEPYYQLLLSEALYKNDYAQTNRDELLVAMAYFDSVNDPFLAARCHYMNGVGYYETDSVVPACEEYMKAIQIMEEHYSEKELVGYKAKFMALTYTRLVDIFSDQYLHKQAIFFGNQALTYYHMFDAEPWQISWMLNEIGTHYDMMGIYDSADCYYHKAIELLPDTNNLTYKMVSGHLAFLNYEKTTDKDPSLKQLYHLLGISESNNEFCSRCLSIGEIYYHETIYDSAWIYLTIVFNNSPSTDAKKQAAQWLAEICKSLGKDAEFIEYASFLVPFANQEENKSEVKSYLTGYYNTFCQNTIERKHQSVIKEQTKRIVWILAGLLVVIIILSILYHSRKKQVGVLTKQMDKEQSGINKRNSLETFLNEPLCQDIILSVQGKNIKRSTLPQDYQELILLDSQLQQLTLLVNRYFNSFDRKLKKFGISNTSMANLCHLYLLGMDEKQAAILLNKDYSTVKRYEKSLKTTFNTQEDLVVFMRNLVLCD